MLDLDDDSAAPAGHRDAPAAQSPRSAADFSVPAADAPAAGRDMRERPGARGWRYRWALAAATAVAVTAAAGWLGLHQPARGGAQAAPVPPAHVSVQVVRARAVHPWTEFSGRIDAVDYAEIRPQVSGRITDIRFRDGQEVKAGDVLFVIDPRPYAATLAKAEADLAVARNNARLAGLEVNRGAKLVVTEALSRETYDQRANASAVAQAQVGVAQADLAQAQLNLDYAYVKAPISGRISRAEITLGNLVGTAPAPLLASIVSSDGVYADFDVDEQTYLDTVRSYAGVPGGLQAVPVELTLGHDGGRVDGGTIESFDNRIDTGTGTIRARARFGNADGSLVPGMFVAVRMGAGALDRALLVPESAIGNDQSKRFVLVAASGKAEYRPVTLGPVLGGDRVVLSGLRPGDKVILDGLLRLRPGAPVAADAPSPRT